MNKMMIMIFGLMVSANVFAKTTSCVLVEDFDDWSITINGSTANFFDNDTNVSLAKSSFSNQDSTVFEGRDQITQVFFSLAPNKRSGKLVLVYPADLTEAPHTYDFKCVTK